VTGPSTLVVANDEPDACEVVARVLELDGHEVVRVSNPEAVAAVVRDTGAAGVVLDLVSGGFGANLDALERLRPGSTRRGPGVRVVLVGTKASQALFAWQSGIDGFLLRPFPADGLRRTVADALARDQKKRAAFRAEEQRLLGVEQPGRPPRA
jgi:DNA-binding NtrC family response regulator